MINEALHLQTQEQQEEMQRDANIQDFRKKNTDLQVFYKEGQKQNNNIEIKKQKEHLKDPRTA